MSDQKNKRKSGLLTSENQLEEEHKLQAPKQVKVENIRNENSQNPEKIQISLKTSVKTQERNPPGEENDGPYLVKPEDVVEDLQEAIGIFPTYKINGKVYLQILGANNRHEYFTLEQVIRSFEHIPYVPGEP
jgi:hypothetical protein